MASGGVVALEFVVNMRRGPQFFFQTVCPDERRGTIHFVEIPDFLRDLDPGVGLIQFLADQLVAEHRPELFKSHRLKRSRVQKRGRLILHIRPEIVPGPGHLIFFDVDLVRDLVLVRHVAHLPFFLLVHAPGRYKKRPVPAIQIHAGTGLVKSCGATRLDA